jgi:hypothetical protein
MLLPLNLDLIDRLRGFSGNFFKISSHLHNHNSCLSLEIYFAIHFYFACISNLEKYFKIIDSDFILTSPDNEKLNGTNVVNVYPIYAAIMQEEKWEKVESNVKEIALDINITYVLK